jgi:hypothetical protein
MFGSTVGSLNILDFQQDRDQRFLLCLEESDEDIACATEELSNLSPNVEIVSGG